MVDGYDADGLPDRVDVTHCLEAVGNGCRVVEYEHLRFEAADGFGWGVLTGEDDHAFAELGSSYFLQRKSDEVSNFNNHAGVSYVR